MSARSINRARVRELERTQRRHTRRAAQISAGAAVALGAGAFFAPGAQAANFQVNSTADGMASACDATCTLRDAIEAANADAAVDTITFAPAVTGVITLTEGELPIDAGVAIQGPGAGALTISGDANSDDAPDGGDSRVFRIDPSTVGVENDPVSISDLTVAEGYSTASGGGLSALNVDLTVADAVFRDNLSSGNRGGAMDVEGRLQIDASSFVDNTADNGGALYADHDSSSTENGDVTITRSTFRGNEAVDYNGGAIYIDQYNDEVLIAGSTFVGNEADDDGGALNVYGARDGGFTLRNATISGNSAGSEGGGVKFGNYFDVPVRVESSTIVGNDAGSRGGGIYRYADDNYTAAPATDDTVVISSTIVADNTAPVGDDLGEREVGVGDDPIEGSFELGHSLIEDAGSDVVVTQVPAGSNQLGQDPDLGPLADNGGPTLTHLPATNSPAVNAGVGNGLATDQRGFARTDDLERPGAAQSDGTDIGAVELRGANVTIDSGPSGTIASDRATFTFSDRPGAVFECRLDDGVFSPCTSPLTLTGLAEGNHVFEVRVTSGDGVQGNTASRSFTVETSGPDVAVAGAKLKAKKTQKLKGEKVKIKVKAGAKEAVDVLAKGKIVAGGEKFGLKKVSKAVQPGKKKTLKLKPKKASASDQILAALAAGEKVKAKIKAKFTDAAGNKTKKKVNVKLK